MKDKSRRSGCLATSTGNGRPETKNMMKASEKLRAHKMARLLMGYSADSIVEVQFMNIL